MYNKIKKIKIIELVVNINITQRDSNQSHC